MQLFWTWRPCQHAGVLCTIPVFHFLSLALTASWFPWKCFRHSWLMSSAMVKCWWWHISALSFSVLIEWPTLGTRCKCVDVLKCRLAYEAIISTSQLRHTWSTSLQLLVSDSISTESCVIRPFNEGLLTFSVSYWDFYYKVRRSWNYEPSWDFSVSPLTFQQRY